MSHGHNDDTLWCFWIMPAFGSDTESWTKNPFLGSLTVPFVKPVCWARWIRGELSRFSPWKDFQSKPKMPTPNLYRHSSLIPSHTRSWQNICGTMPFCKMNRIRGQSGRSKFLDSRRCNSGGIWNHAICLYSPDRHDDRHLSDNCVSPLDGIASLRPEAIALGSPQALESLNQARIIISKKLLKLLESMSPWVHESMSSWVHEFMSPWDVICGSLKWHSMRPDSILILYWSRIKLAQSRRWSPAKGEKSCIMSEDDADDRLEFT
jgi:hypothetical protein